VPPSVGGSNPKVRFAGAAWCVMLPDLASLAAAEIGPPVPNLADARPALPAAVDLLVTGM
jgi:hypothetical protein